MRASQINTRVVVASSKESKSLWRRALLALGAAGLIPLAAFVFSYVRYSKIIDERLRGEAIIPATAIYAAPRSIKVGQRWNLAGLKGYLDAAGYVETGKEADPKRGRYSIKGNAVEIRSSQEAIIDGKRQFPNIAIWFGADGKVIRKIFDLDSKRNLESAQLEPPLLTALSNEKRQKRKIVSFKDLPKDYINAVLAAEDRQFFEHSGINFRGIFRALWRNLEEGEARQGGSSITQQLVKNFFLTPERTLKRKLQEMMMALVLESRLSKEEIFQLYANEVYMGQAGSYSINGVGEAASTYFNKEVVNLNLSECAFLAGLIRGPSLYSPYRDKERAIWRRNQVLDSMVEAGFITREQAERAKSAELAIQPRRAALSQDAPYFVDYLQERLRELIPDSDAARRYYRIYATIDMELQRAADRAINNRLAELDKMLARSRRPMRSGTVQVALIALNAKTGEILAMVGGRDYSSSQLNRAVEARRQPGSAFKPIVYAAALNTAYEGPSREAITPASLFLDAPMAFYYGRGQTYSPENFGKSYSNRNVTLRDALVHSLNVVTVKVAETIGYGKVARMAEQLGLPRPLELPATALGTAEATPLEVARAYTAFANGGRLVEPRPVNRVTRQDGSPIIEMQPQVRQAIRPQVSWIVTNMLEDVLDRGTAARARAMGFTAVAAGKTGTSRDGWFVGYTPNLICVVWVGFDDNSELGLEGAKSALPIWTDFMKAALSLRPDLAGDQFPLPEGILSAEIDPLTGLLASDSCSMRRIEYFIEGTEPTEKCSPEAEASPPAINERQEKGPQGEVFFLQLGAPSLCLKSRPKEDLYDKPNRANTRRRSRLSAQSPV
jgi:penicillin-binding protein 1B